MNIKKKSNRDYTDMYDLYELIEMGLNEEEIAKDFAVSPKYVRSLIYEIEKFDKNY